MDEGHQVVVIAPIDEYIEYKEKYPDINHVSLRSLDRDGINPIKDLVLIEELRRKYKRLQPDLIIHYTHKPNIFGTIAAKINNITSVAVVTGLGYSFINKGWINKVSKILYKLVGKYTAKMIFENVDDKELFIQQNLIKKEKAYSIKGCGVDVEYYKPSLNGMEKDHTTFTFIGRLLKDKGIREYVEAAKRIKAKRTNCIFQVIGDFDQENPSTIDKEELLSWIEQEIIVYDGHVKDVRSYIAHADCIVLPSYREGMPRIVLEGMAMEKPIITTKVAGCRETVDHEVNGFLVESQDVSSLVNGMTEFLTLKKDERIRMGKEGRKKVLKNFTSEIIAENIFQLTKD